jgi:hypothetical protein
MINECRNNLCSGYQPIKEKKKDQERHCLDQLQEKAQSGVLYIRNEASGNATHGELWFLPSVPPVVLEEPDI